MPQDHWLPGFNFNVEEWSATGLTFETLAICRTLAQALAVFAAAIEEPVHDSEPDAGGEAAPRGRLVKHWTKGQLAVSRKDNTPYPGRALISAQQSRQTNMRPKIQAQARARTADELTSARTAQIFELAMTAAFVVMLTLNAISH